MTGDVGPAAHGGIPGRAGEGADMVVDGGEVVEGRVVVGRATDVEVLGTLAWWRRTEELWAAAAWFGWSLLPATNAPMPVPAIARIARTVRMTRRSTRRVRTNTGSEPGPPSPGPWGGEPDRKPTGSVIVVLFVLRASPPQALTIETHTASANEWPPPPTDRGLRGRSLPLPGAGSPSLARRSPHLYGLGRIAEHPQLVTATPWIGWDQRPTRSGPRTWREAVGRTSHLGMSERAKRLIVINTIRTVPAKCWLRWSTSSLGRAGAGSGTRDRRPVENRRPASPCGPDSCRAVVVVRSRRASGPTSLAAPRSAKEACIRWPSMVRPELVRVAHLTPHSEQVMVRLGTPTIVPRALTISECWNLRRRRLQGRSWRVHSSIRLVTPSLLLCPHVR